MLVTNIPSGIFSYTSVQIKADPVHVIFTAWEKLQEEEPVYFNRFRAVLSDVEKELPGSSFVFTARSQEADESDGNGMIEEFEENGDSFFLT